MNAVDIILPDPFKFIGTCHNGLRQIFDLKVIQLGLRKLGWRTVLKNDGVGREVDVIFFGFLEELRP
ncbi:hypothetical protein D3C75_1167660 [compost metagenome]